MTITRALYRAARLSATAGAIASGNPKRIARRGRNVALGRALFGRRGNRPGHLAVSGVFVNDEGRVRIGHDPECEKWEILEVGSIDVDIAPDGLIRFARYPGWVMRSRANPAQMISTCGGEALGAFRPDGFTIGGYTLLELQKIANEAR